MWLRSAPPLFYGPYHYAPYPEVVFGIDTDRGVGGIGGPQFYVSFRHMAKIEIFYGEFAIDESHYYVAVGRFK